MRALQRTRNSEVGGRGAAAGSEGGFGFVEAMVALVLLSFAVLGIAQMMITAIYAAEASEDLTSITSLGSQQLEALRATDYDALVPGGDLATSVTGYFDDLDLDNAAGAEIVRRWQITDVGDALQIDVRVIGPPNASGGNRDIRLTALVAEE